MYGGFLPAGRRASGSRAACTAWPLRCGLLSTTRCRRRSATIRAICRRGEMRWTGERYRRKVMQTAAVIDSLGLPLVGLYGVENESVVRDVAAACKGDYAYLFRTTDSYNGLDFAPVLLRRPLLPGQGGGGPFLDDGGGRTARSRARVSADERQRPLYRLQDRVSTAGCIPTNGCWSRGARRVPSRSAADCRNPCGGTPCRTGYATCGESLGNAQ